MRSLFLNLFCQFELLDMTRLVCFEMSITSTSATFYFALTTLPMQRSVIAEAGVHMFQASFDECPSMSRVQFWPLQLVGCGFRCDTTMGSHRRRGSKMSSKRRNAELFWLLWALLLCVLTMMLLCLRQGPHLKQQKQLLLFSLTLLTPAYQFTHGRPLPRSDEIQSDARLVLFLHIRPTAVIISLLRERCPTPSSHRAHQVIQIFGHGVLGVLALRKLPDYLSRRAAGSPAGNRAAGVARSSRKPGLIGSLSCCSARGRPTRRRTWSR